MKTKLSFILFLLLMSGITSLNAQTMTPKMQEFITRMDTASLEELEEELDEGIKAFRSMAVFFEAPKTEIQSIPKEEETYGETFKVDTSVVSKALGQFDDIGFKQTFLNNRSRLKFEKIGNPYWNTVWITEGIAESFTPKKIHYKDGTSVSKNINSNKISFIWEKDWGRVAIIDSVEIDYSINYVVQYDSVLLTTDTKKIKYKDGFIKLQKLQNNHLAFTISDAYAHDIHVRAFNDEGKALGFNSSTSSSISDGTSTSEFTKLLQFLERTQSKLKAKKFKSTEALKNYVLKKASKMEIAKKNDGVYYKKYNYQGTIETAQLYIVTERKSKTTSFVATNDNAFDEVSLMRTKTENVFLDADAKELFRTPFTPLQSLGLRYFQNDSLYYHLNLKTKTLDVIPATNIRQITNGLAFIENRTEDFFGTYDADYKLISDIPFKIMTEINEEYVRCIDADNVTYILNANGSVNKLEGIDFIGPFQEGRMFAKSNGKYGFLDASGKIVIPFQFDNIASYGDGLAAVANEEGLFGYIDLNGKSVLPYTYEHTNPFENGIALVRFKNKNHLIDKTGKILVSSDTFYSSTSGSGIEKTYQLGDSTYDAFGKLIHTEASKK